MIGRDTEFDARGIRSRPSAAEAAGALFVRMRRLPATSHDLAAEALLGLRSALTDVL